MSYTKKILSSMKVGCVYRVCDLAALNNEPDDEIRRVMKLLHKGDLVEEIKTNEYRRKRLYKTKQQDLFEAPPQALIDSVRI